jgi:hypothetical protein
MRRLTLFISIALAMLAFSVPAVAGAKTSHHKRHHHARVADRNHNGMPDRWERRHRVHSATADPDRDGVANLGEYHNGTNPRDADTDNDGVEDGADDANHDGIADGEEQSGTIASFDGTTLIVTLVNGDTLKGTVSDRTEIECQDAATTRDGSESGDTQDQGDNEDQGDDDQGENEDGQGGAQGSCGTDALTAGTIVKEAELHLTSAGAVFEKIDLGGKAQA